MNEDKLRRLSHAVGDDYKIISFKMFQNRIGKLNVAKDIYFCKCSGTNALKGKNIIVAGTPFMKSVQYLLVGSYLGKINDQANQQMRRIEYGNYTFRTMTYSDRILQRLQCYWLISEIEQAVGRARLISEPAEVIVFSTIPCEQAEYISKDFFAERGIIQDNQQDLNSA